MGELSEKMEFVGQEAYLYAPDVAQLEAEVKRLTQLYSDLQDEHQDLHNASVAANDGTSRLSVTEYKYSIKA